MPNIAKWLDFEFYDLVWWLDRHGKPNVTDDIRRLGRWLGTSHRVGSDLCYWIVTESGRLVSKTSVEHMTQEDYVQEGMKEQIEEFNKKLEERLDDTNFTLDDIEMGSNYLEDIDYVDKIRVLPRNGN